MNCEAYYPKGSTSETEIPTASLQVSERKTQDETDTSPSDHHTSTASCLPQDVLIAIFSQLHHLPPWEASAVCRWWRGTALSCTQLWSEITFEDLHFVHDKLKVAKDGPGQLLDRISRKYRLETYRLSLQLERLGSHPRTLHLNVTSPDRSPSIMDDQVKELMCHLISTFHLCSEITILRSGSYSALNFQGPISFPFLRHLHLRGHSWTRGCFQDTPTLKSLHLEDLMLFKQSDLQFGWEGLVDLKITSSSVDVRVLLAVLALPSSLAYLTIRSADITSQDPGSILKANSLPVVELPNLSFLVMSFSFRPGGLVCTRRLMQQLRTPKLATLRVGYVNNESLNITCSFLESSDCVRGLKHLTIDSPMRVRKWDPLIRLLPQLEALQALHIGPMSEADLTLPKEVSPTIPSIDSLLEALVWPSVAFTDLPGDSSPSSLPNRIHIRPCLALQFLQLEHMPMSTDLLRSMILSRIPASVHSALIGTKNDRPLPLEDWCYLKCVVLRTGESLLWDTSPHPLSKLKNGLSGYASWIVKVGYDSRSLVLILSRRGLATLYGGRSRSAQRFLV